MSVAALFALRGHINERGDERGEHIRLERQLAGPAAPIVLRSIWP